MEILLPLLVLTVVVGTYLSVSRARPSVVDRDGVTDSAALQRVESMLRERLAPGSVRREQGSGRGTVIVADLVTELTTGQPLYRMYSRAIEIRILGSRLLVTGIPNPFRVSISGREREYSARILREVIALALGLSAWAAPIPRVITGTE